MTSYDPKRYKHLPKFGYIVYNCHFPNNSVNHSETPYAVPEDYKNDDDFLQHYRSCQIGIETSDYIGDKISVGVIGPSHVLEQSVSCDR